MAKSHFVMNLFLWKNTFLNRLSLIIVNYFPVFAVATTGSISKAIIFIDASNLYHSLKRSFGSAKINFNTFCEYISQGQEIIQINYYAAALNQNDSPEEYKSQQKFFNYLRKNPKVRIFLGRLERRDNTLIEKGVDVKLAVDLVLSAYERDYDIAILVSNDADFVPAIIAAQKLGKRIKHISFPKRASYHLMQACDEVFTVKSNKSFSASDANDKKKFGTEL